MNIKPTSLTINQLFGAPNEQYVIPTYQRRYSWQERQIFELIEDIVLMDASDTHLMGSIVCLTGPHAAGINKLELVDGQQRLTTISIVLSCIAERMKEIGEDEDAAGLNRLLISKAVGEPAQRKVVLDSIDADDYSSLLNGRLDGDCKNVRLQDAFLKIRDWIKTQTIKDLQVFLYRLTNNAIVIRLDVSEAKDAFKLFETINNRGLKLSPTDIIKNFLLGNAARIGVDSLEIARNSWSKLVEFLDGTNSDTFFRHFLMTLVKTRVTASEVVPVFKKLFMGRIEEARRLPERHLYADDEYLDSDENENIGIEQEIEPPQKSTGNQILLIDFLAGLVSSAKIYGQIALAKTGDQKIDRHLKNLQMIKAGQTYGFLMHLRVGGCSDNTFREILGITESFVLRRHICRERSNETEALFARLCSVEPTRPYSKTCEEYSERCPSDEKFREEFSSAHFTASLIDRARYCLEKIEAASHGDFNELQVLGSQDVHVEHIIPRQIKTKKCREEFGDWVTYLGKNSEVKHPKYVSRIGNLTLFSGILNISASNNPFARKKNSYSVSGINLTRKLAEKAAFKFNDVESRSSELADVAVTLWPIPR